MKKFRQELAECTEQQRVEIYHLWGLDGFSDKGPQKRPDILLKRNEHLLKELRERLPESDNFIIPWGAVHMPGIAKEIQKSGREVHGGSRIGRVV